MRILCLICSNLFKDIFIESFTELIFLLFKDFLWGIVPYITYNLEVSLFLLLLLFLDYGLRYVLYKGYKMLTEG